MYFILLLHILKILMSYCCLCLGSFDHIALMLDGWCVVVKIFRCSIISGFTLGKFDAYEVWMAMAVILHQFKLLAFKQCPWTN